MSRSGRHQKEDGRDDRRTPTSAAAAASSSGEPGATGCADRCAPAYQPAGCAAVAACCPHGRGRQPAVPCCYRPGSLPHRRAGVRDPGRAQGRAAKLGQAMSVFDAALPEEVAAPYRSALRRLTDAAPAMPAEVARRVVAADLAAAYGPDWQERPVAFHEIPAAAASIGQVHRGQWRIDGGQVVEVAVKVQYPGVGQALRSDLRQARLCFPRAGVNWTTATRRTWPPGCSATPSTRPRRAPAGCTPT